MSRGNETWIGEFKTDIRMGFHSVGRTVKKNQAAVGQRFLHKGYILQLKKYKQN